MTDARLALIIRNVASAPLTFAWLFILLVTTRVQRSAGRRGSRKIQHRHSTNLRRLRTEPSRVLVTSLFWLDGRTWWPYVPVFVSVVAAAERRLRWWRWLLVGSAAHVIGTYLGQGHLQRGIRAGGVPRRLANARDLGVSYFVFGVAGTLTGYVRQPARTRWQATVLTVLTACAVIKPSYTTVGHATAYVVGLAAIPLAPDRDAAPFPAQELAG